MLNTQSNLLGGHALGTAAQIIQPTKELETELNEQQLNRNNTSVEEHKNAVFVLSFIHARAGKIFLIYSAKTK